MARPIESSRDVARIDAAALLRRVRAYLAEHSEPGALSSFIRRVRHRSAGEGGLSLVDDAETLRFLARVGVIDSRRRSHTTARQVSLFLEEAARSGMQEEAVAGVLLRAFASGLYGVSPEPVCGDAPRCELCPLSSACAEHNRPQTVPVLFEKGQEPSELLLSDGASSLTAEELMSVLVSGNTKSRSTQPLEECKRLLREHGGLRGVAQLDLSQAEAMVSGRGALRLVVAMEIARRWAAEPRATGIPFRTGADFYNYYRLRLRDLKREVFVAVILDQKARFLADEFCSQGTLTASLVHPREAFRKAIRESAAAIAFVHNHPSGNPQPSQQDRDLTERLVEVSRIIGIRLVDHVVIGDGSFVSFNECGWL